MSTVDKGEQITSDERAYLVALHAQQGIYLRESSRSLDRQIELKQDEIDALKEKRAKVQRDIHVHHVAALELAG